MRAALRRGPLDADPALLGIAAALIAAGLLSLRSVGLELPKAAPYFGRQAVNVAIGLLPLFALASLRLRGLQRMAWPLYVVQIALLIGVLLVGSSKKGAERWIEIGPMQFQPSEMAKFGTVLALAEFYRRLGPKVSTPAGFWGGLAVVALPVALILRQPHLGAALVLLAAWLFVSLAAGVRVTALLAVVVVGAALVVGVFKVPAISERVLRDYQRSRVEGLAKRGSRPQDRDYQTDQAEIAFGNGGVWGEGFGRGTQKKNGFVPEQHNDFVFTVVGEEGGFVGSLLILGLFGALFSRFHRTATNAGDPFGRSLVTGLFAVLAFHTVANLGMVTGLLPVVGLWLPFLSYGGTAMWLAMACVGATIAVRREG